MMEFEVKSDRFCEAAVPQVVELEKLEIPDRELQISFSSSPGPGGQNVNKVATKATLKWHIASSELLSDAQKSRLLEHELLRNRINSEGEVVLYHSSERSQLQNRLAVVEKLNELVRKALKPKRRRKKTKPTKRAKEERLQNKKQRGALKAERQKKYGEND